MWLWAFDITIFSQKIFSNCYISEPIQRSLLHSIKALCDTLLVKGIGLIPIDGGSRLKFAGAHGAFELLRVRTPSLSSAVSSILTPFQVRNRFAAQSPPGGYRDMNLKIRVGFKSDPNTGQPLFCPVYVESFSVAITRYCLCILMSWFRKLWDQRDVKTMVRHPALIPAGLLTSGLQVVEIQVQLKVGPCTRVWSLVQCAAVKCGCWLQDCCADHLKVV